jgi:hypothetical protein
VENPFTYAKPVPPDQLIDREAELEQLHELTRGGHNCRLAAPRRYGKTSLIGRLRAEAENDGRPTVYVNFYGILSVADAVARLERGYREVRGPVARWLSGRLTTLGASIGGVSLSSARPQEPEQRLYDLLELPRQVFKRDGERMLVCFDEFQEVLSPRTALDGAIRSVIEQHHLQAAYVFAGSSPGMMRALFDDRERPFYGQARSIVLAPLAAEDLAEHIGGRFDATGRDIGDALPPLLTLAQGHPQRAMLLAHFTWERTPRGETADESTAAEALAAVLQDLGEGFERSWRGFDDGERRALAAIVGSGGEPTRTAALTAVDAPRTTVVKALARLEEAGHALHDDGGWRLVDPLFAHWVSHGRADA